MAILFKDRVKDTSTSTGTGNFTLAGSPPSGYISFNSAFGTGSTNQFYYCIDGGSEWEVGIGHLSASTTLVRDTFLASSSGSTVSFSAGSKTVFATAAAAAFGKYRTLGTTSDVNATDNDTPASVTELSTSVSSGKTYQMIFEGFVNCSDGLAYLDMNGGSATFTSITGIRDAYGLDSSTDYAPSLFDQLTDNMVYAVGDAGLSYFRTVANLVVDAGGTFIPQFSQQFADGTSTLKRGSVLTLIEC